jgi:hypothetical protein
MFPCEIVQPDGAERKRQRERERERFALMSAEKKDERNKKK